MRILSSQRSPDLFVAPEVEAQRILFQLADHLYANTALKPMSKTLFAISRLLLVVHGHGNGSPKDVQGLEDAYRTATGKLAGSLEDDFSFPDIAEQCRSALPRIVSDFGNGRSIDG